MKIIYIIYPVFIGAPLFFALCCSVNFLDNPISFDAMGYGLLAFGLLYLIFYSLRRWQRINRRFFLSYTLLLLTAGTLLSIWGYQLTQAVFPEFFDALG